MELSRQPIKETALADQGGNLYKFYMAHCICEIVNRFRMNNEKAAQILPVIKRLISTNELMEQGDGATQSSKVDFEVTDF